MIDFFVDMYRSCQKTHLFYSFLRFVVRVGANIFLPVYFRMNSKNPRYSLLLPSNENGQIIVSFTSFPARIRRLWLVVECLLHQTRKPDRIILWLSEEQFIGQHLPQNLRRLEKRGLEIKWCKEDLRSHKKYFYTLQYYPKATLITVDDDILYSSSMLLHLVELANQYPSSVICHYARYVGYREGKILPYREWKYVENFQEDAKKLFFGSGGGTLFPPGVFYKDILNKDIFKSLCFQADDIWLNTMIRLNGSKILVSGYGQGMSPLPVLNRKDVSLASLNVDENQNDIQLSLVREYYMQQLDVDPFYFK